VFVAAHILFFSLHITVRSTVMFSVLVLELQKSVQSAFGGLACRRLVLALVTSNSKREAVKPEAVIVYCVIFLVLVFELSNK
jgi:hypothetical protein